MRELIVQTNIEVRQYLSNDLGAFAGLLFEIGSGRLLVDGNVAEVLKVEQAKAEKAARSRHAAFQSEQSEESEVNSTRKCN